MFDQIMVNFVKGINDSTILPIWLQTLSAFLAVIAAFGGAGIIICQLWLDHRWRKMQYTLEIVKNWNDFFADNVPKIRKRFPDLLIQKEDAENLCKIENINEDDLIMRGTILGLLNKLEYVCTAYNNNVVNKKVFDEQLKDGLLQWHSWTKNLIDSECRRCSGVNYFPRFCDYVKKG